jgi:thioesterase domain-containing protein
MGMTELSVARRSYAEVENTIRELWSGYFGRDVSRYDDFYDLGGDSLAAIDLVAQARERGLRVRSSEALRYSTPARLAEHLTIRGEEQIPVPALETVRDTAVGSVPTGAASLYVVHSDSHGWVERETIAAWGIQRPVLGFRLTSGDINENVDRFLAAIEQTEGQYRLAGFGNGAVVAYEMARRLRNRGADVALLALIKPAAEQAGEPLLERRLTMIARRFGLSGDETLDEIHRRMTADGWYEDVRPQDLPRLQRLWVDMALALRTHDLGEYDGPTVLFQDIADSRATELTWRDAVKNLETHWFDYGVESPHAILRDARLAETMRRALTA